MFHGDVLKLSSTKFTLSNEYSHEDMDITYVLFECISTYILLYQTIPQLHHKDNPVRGQHVSNIHFSFS